MSEDLHRVDAEGHSGESTLQHGCKQGGAQALAGNVSNQDRDPSVRQGAHVEVVPANLVTGAVHASDGEMRIILQSVRNQGLLDLAGDAQFLLKTLAFSFVLDQPGSL